jgi:hypothetical protein
MKIPTHLRIAPLLAGGGIFLLSAGCERSSDPAPANPAMPDRVTPENVPDGGGVSAGDSGGGSSSGPSSGGDGTPGRQRSRGIGP